MELPKYNSSTSKGDIGATIVKSIVQSELNWIYRENHKENDFGIDAYFDLITEQGNLTGKTIAVQIKTGDSYFKEKNEFGWIYRGELKHLNYYLNHQIPVVLILVDDIKRMCHWSLCDAKKTTRTRDKWKITIPSNQLLNKSSKAELTKYVSPVLDYTSQLEDYWNLNKQLLKNKRINLVVSKEEIIKRDYMGIKEAFSRLESNAELLTYFKNRIDVSIYGYDFDSRELFEIPEVIQWIKKMFKKYDGWIYFLSMDKQAAFLRLLQILHSEVKIEKPLVKIATETSKKFADKCYIGLNRFCERTNVSVDTNADISEMFTNYIFDTDFKIDRSQLDKYRT